MRPRGVKGLGRRSVIKPHLFPCPSEERAAILNHSTTYPKFLMTIYHCYNQKAIFKNENGLRIAHFWCKQLTYYL